MTSFKPLGEREEQLQDRHEMYQRQCHPSFYQEGEPTSQIFAAFPRDKGELSGTRDSKVTAEESYREYTQVMGLQSVGVWGISVGEAEDAGSRVVDDSQKPTKQRVPQGHVYLDMKHMTRIELKRLRVQLLERAKARGILYPPKPLA